MTAKQKRPVELVLNRDGSRIFISLRDCGISPMIAMIDCLPMTFFGKGKTAYLEVDVALAWFEKELPHVSGSKLELFEKAVEKYRDILVRFRQGEIIACDAPPPAPKPKPKGGAK